MYILGKLYILVRYLFVICYPYCIQLM